MNHARPNLDAVRYIGRLCPLAEGFAIVKQHFIRANLHEHRRQPFQIPQQGRREDIAFIMNAKVILREYIKHSFRNHLIDFNFT